MVCTSYDPLTTQVCTNTGYDLHQFPTPMQVMLVTFGMLQVLGVDGGVGSLQGLQDIGQLSTLIHLTIIVGLIKVNEISHGLDELNRSGLELPQAQL